MATDPLIMVLVRWAHFVAAFTAIGALFTSVMIVTPVMMKVQPAVRASVMVKLLPRTIRVQIWGSLVLMAAGVVLAITISGGDLSAFISTKWGLSILAGAILTLVIFSNTVLVARSTARSLVSLLSQLSSSEAKPSASQALPKLQLRMSRVVNTNFGIALIVLFLMGFAAHG